MKIALFGGSFNPVHNGHLEIADALLEDRVVDKVWLVPCGNHAFDKTLAPAQCRLDLLRLAVKDNPNISIIESEINSRTKSYSSETIRSLKSQFPYDFYFVIGADNLKEIGKWHDLDYLKENVKFILVSRPGYPILSTGINIYYALPSNNPTSSTLVRERLKNNLSIEGLVPKEVEDYLLTHKGFFK